MFNPKTLSRLFIIVRHSASLFLPSVANLITSAIIIRLIVPEWWGQITILQLYMYIATQVCAWGNKDFLMKEFSNKPSQVKELWMESLSGRFFLLIPAILATLFIGQDITSIICLSLWLIFRYFMQSFEVIILYNRQFTINIISEITAIIITISGLIIFKDILTYHDILLIITLGYFSKTIIQIIYYKHYFNFNYSIKPNLKKLKYLFPFMMLGLVVVMNQKTDMICVASMCSKLEVAQYQVFSSFFLFIQSIPGLIAGPYIKNLYRISSSTYKKIQLLFTLLGLLVTCVCMILTYVILTKIYGFNFPISMYFLGFIYGSIAYFYMLQILLLFKNQQQNQVLAIGIITIILNSILCFIFIPMLGIQGVVLANVITQITLLALYNYFWKVKLNIHLP